MSLRDQLKTDLKRVIFNTDDFAETATFTPKATGLARLVNGIFRENFTEEDEGGSRSRVESSQPNFQCASDDIATNADGDILQLRDTTYYVMFSKLKSNTTILLMLSKDKP